jgi:hypothetical protein
MTGGYHHLAGEALLGGAKAEALHRLSISKVKFSFSFVHSRVQIHFLNPFSSLLNRFLFVFLNRILLTPKANSIHQIFLLLTVYQVNFRIPSKDSPAIRENIISNSFALLILSSTGSFP